MRGMPVAVRIPNSSSPGEVVEIESIAERATSSQVGLKETSRSFFAQPVYVQSRPGYSTLGITK